MFLLDVVAGPEALATQFVIIPIVAAVIIVAIAAVVIIKCVKNKKK